MRNANGQWIGFGLGDVDPKVAAMKAFLKKKFSYASVLDTSDTYDQTMVTVVSEMQAKYGLAVTGVMDYATQVKCGFLKAAPVVKPVMFTVEGHLSNMFSGPVADTATQLENEGVCHHQPIGYDNGAIPFDNNSGVTELARLVGSTVLDDGTPFPAGTPWSGGAYSQGSIVWTDFFIHYLQPGQALNWRLKDLKGVLAYGNPCRQTDSVAPWSMAWTSTPGTHGLDPYVRLGLPGFPAKPDFWMDVYREGDIFAENGDDKASQIKASVYQAIARGDVFSNPYSLAAQIADLFTVSVDEVIGIVMAIVGGIEFLVNGNGAPHYAPYDISGGVNWMRQQLT